jgi:hypothetical protein
MRYRFVFKYRDRTNERMLDFDLDPYVLDDEPLTYPPPLLVSVIKNGPLKPEAAFSFYGITGSRGVDRALSLAIGTPAITSRPFGYLRVSGYRDVEMQFVDVVRGLEKALLHEGEDENGEVVSSLPDLVLVTCPLSTRREERILDWARLNGVRYAALDGETPFMAVGFGRARA